MNRWDNFTLQERSLIHHALRMLAKFPSEEEAATPLADEVWDYHVQATAFSHVLTEDSQNEPPDFDVPGDDFGS